MQKMKEMMEKRSWVRVINGASALIEALFSLAEELTGVHKPQRLPALARHSAG
jgi:hypothetical protein